jgi:hypothetical protein
MMFGSVSEHFANLRHVKRCKTCVSGLNALFWGTEVANNSFYSIRPRCLGVFRRILLTYGTQKDVKLVFGDKMHYFGAPK